VALALASLITLAPFGETSARAEEPLPPLPPPPPDESSPAPPSPAPPEQSPDVSPPTRYTYAPPPAGPRSLSSAHRRHAPEYSLWLGGRAGVLAYSGALYISDPYSPSGIETTGNFVRPGIALEADVGVRLARRFIPYFAFEVGFVGAGRRFDGTATNAVTTFTGLGFRYLAGDVDSVSFASDISLGFRKFQLSNASSTWTATAFELFRLAFGAEIRLSTHFTVSPMLTLSGGSVTDTSGFIAFAPNQADGLTGPPTNGIPVDRQQSYFVIVLGCGTHFDLLGN
jgi:hypothetical protein